MWRDRPERTMLSTPAPDMMEPADLVEPVTFHYEMRTPWGWTAQDFTVDIKVLLSDPAYIGPIGWHLWRSTIATAISTHVRLDLLWYVRWRVAPLATPYVGSQSAEGRQYHDASPRDRSGTVVMHTGHTDSYAARRLFLPAIPTVWHSDGMLNDRGWDSMMTWAQGVKMGLAWETSGGLGGDMQHLLAYPYIIPPTIGNFGGVLFRPVKWLKVCQYLGKAPELPSGLWP